MKTQASTQAHTAMAILIGLAKPFCLRILLRSMAGHLLKSRMIVKGCPCMICNQRHHVCVQANLLEERDPGVLLAIVTLLLGIVSRSYEGAHCPPPPFLLPRTFSVMFLRRSLGSDTALQARSQPLLDSGHALEHGPLLQ